MSSEEQYLRTVEAGAVIFSEGEVGEEMYVVQAGRVQLTREASGQPVLVAILPAGEFFGEMALLNSRPRSATATALEETRLLVVPAQRFTGMLHDHPDVALRLIQKLAMRLERANEQIDVLLLKDTNHRVVHALRQLAEKRGTPVAGGLRIQVTMPELAGLVGLDEVTVRATVARLARAQLLVPTLDPQRGTGALGAAATFTIPEVGKLQEFLEFLELRDRFG